MILSKRREAYRESLREDILDSARQLFVLNGYEATSIRAIAAKVGCSPGILYHYFEDKQDIMALLVRETFIKLRTRLSAILEDKDAIEARLRRGLRAYIDFGLENPHHYALLFMNPNSMDGNEKIIAAFSEEGMKSFDCLRQLVIQAIQSSCLRPELKDPDELSQSLWASIHGMVSIRVACQGFPWVERSRLIDRQLDILMSGILKV
jgi:AcrR family transcriptional regulator